MKVAVFLNNLELGGTPKAAFGWALGLKERGHAVEVLTLQDGVWRCEFEEHGLTVRAVDCSAQSVATALKDISPDIIHAHAPGNPQEGDVLGEALATMKKIPVVQTNIFGKFQNPKEDAWTDFRLFVSWTNCVQAARRVFRPLDEKFFRRASVAVNPLDVAEPSSASEVAAFRKRIGVADDEILFGRFSRPELNKWTNLALDAFQAALQRNKKIKLLLREPPPSVAEKLRASPDARHFIILPATSDAEELRLTMSALDVVLHTSSIGESFGYGIAEPMNLGKPVIGHSVPWGDQAQIELVRHGECGFIASTPATMAAAILRLADDAALRERMGRAAQPHIRALASRETSVARLEQFMRALLEGRGNPFLADDVKKAAVTAAYLDAHQFGHTLGEQFALRPFYYRVRFSQWRKARLQSRN